MKVCYTGRMSIKAVIAGFLVGLALPVAAMGAATGLEQELAALRNLINHNAAEQAEVDAVQNARLDRLEAALPAEAAEPAAPVSVREPRQIGVHVQDGIPDHGHHVTACREDAVTVHGPEGARLIWRPGHGGDNNGWSEVRLPFRLIVSMGKPGNAEEMARGQHSATWTMLLPGRQIVLGGVLWENPEPRLWDDGLIHRPAVCQG